MRTLPILIMVIAALLLAACSSGTATQNPAGGEGTAPASGTPTATDGGAGGSDSGLISAYPPVAEDESLQRGTVYLDENGLAAVEGQPGAVQLVISGSLPTPCLALRAAINPPDAKNAIAVDLYSVVDPNKICTQVLKPISGPVVTFSGLPAGTYTVLLNGVELGKMEMP